MAEFSSKLHYPKNQEENARNVPVCEKLIGRTRPIQFIFVGDDAFAFSTYMMKKEYSITDTTETNTFAFRESGSDYFIMHLSG